MMITTSRSGDNCTDIIKLKYLKVKNEDYNLKSSSEDQTGVSLLNRPL